MGVVAELSLLGVEVIILQGNHDYLRAGHAYFSFLNHLPGVMFVSKMQDLPDDCKGPAVYMLPHTKNPTVDWAGLDFSHYDYLLMHQTVSGAIASNGQVMDGESMPTLNAGKVWSGDIHVPQVIGAVEYVGSPYHVHFGDKFTPRCVLIDRRRRAVDLHFETLHRVALTVRSIEELDQIHWLRRADQIKLTIELAQSEQHEWRVIRREAMAILTDRGVDVHGLDMKVRARRSRMPGAGDVADPSRIMRTDAELVLDFVSQHELGGDALEVGLGVLR